MKGRLIAMHDETAVLSVAEVAARLGLLQPSVRDAVRRGYLQPARLAEEEPHFTPAAIARYRLQLSLGETSDAEAVPSEHR